MGLREGRGVTYRGHGGPVVLGRAVHQEEHIRQQRQILHTPDSTGQLSPDARLAPDLPEASGRLWAPFMSPRLTGKGGLPVAVRGVRRRLGRRA